LIFVENINKKFHLKR